MTTCDTRTPAEAYADTVSHDHEDQRWQDAHDGYAAGLLALAMDGTESERVWMADEQQRDDEREAARLAWQNDDDLESLTCTYCGGAPGGCYHCRGTPGQATPF